MNRAIDLERIEGLVEDKCNRAIVAVLRGEEEGEMLTISEVIGLTNGYSYDSIRKHAYDLSEAGILVYSVQRISGTQRVYMRLEDNNAVKHFLRTVKNYTT